MECIGKRNEEEIPMKIKTKFKEHVFKENTQGTLYHGFVISVEFAC